MRSPLHPMASRILLVRRSMQNRMEGFRTVEDTTTACAGAQCVTCPGYRRAGFSSIHPTLWGTCAPRIPTPASHNSFLMSSVELIGCPISWHSCCPYFCGNHPSPSNFRPLICCGLGNRISTHATSMNLWMNSCMDGWTCGYISLFTEDLRQLFF